MPFAFDREAALVTRRVSEATSPASQGLVASCRLPSSIPKGMIENIRTSAQRHLRLFVEDGASTPKWVADLVVNDLPPHSGLARAFRGVSGGVRLRSNHRLFSKTPSAYEDLWVITSSSPRPLRQKLIVRCLRVSAQLIDEPVGARVSPPSRSLITRSI
ncbi:hypothetical protein CA85_21670 [Allorhodopirellula solitaria]|uniref:Uncharacterized protein n=1 Tax=Allorhodopirellula solitaria TaxID=2527987 RepID=A0A5C5XVH7_9BACT|nr:hypothetical protein CA85_21670 [Allorhodopirellula solitaria]